jgi:hypothetical protein
VAVAFGTGDILFSDGFAYADGALNTVGASNWGAPYAAGDPICQVVSNKVTGSGPSAFSSAYTLRSFPNDIDVILRIATLPSNHGHSVYIGICGQQMGTSGPDGYAIRMQYMSTSDDTWRTYRVVDDSYTSLVTGYREFVAGEYFGVRRTGSTIQMFYGTSNRTWTQVGSNVSDSTYSGGGRVWIVTEGNVVRVDTFEVRRQKRSGLLLRGCGG